MKARSFLLLLAMLPLWAAADFGHEDRGSSNSSASSEQAAPEDDAPPKPNRKERFPRAPKEKPIVKATPVSNPETVKTVAIVHFKAPAERLAAAKTELERLVIITEMSKDVKAKEQLMYDLRHAELRKLIDELSRRKRISPETKNGTQRLGTDYPQLKGVRPLRRP